jgi:hypothetical protein
MRLDMALIKNCHPRPISSTCRNHLLQPAKNFCSASAGSAIPVTFAFSSTAQK